MPLTRADVLGRKMVNAMHVDFSRSESAWMGEVEGVPRLGVARHTGKGNSAMRWYVDQKRVRDLDAALAVLNGELILEAAVAEEQKPEEQKPAQKFSITAQIAEVEREIGMREKVYARMTFPNGTWRNKTEADLALAILRSVLETLKWGKDNRADVVEWIKAGKPKVEKAA